MENIPRFNARVDRETVFLKDHPTGTLVNTTMLISHLQRRLTELRSNADMERDAIVRSSMRGGIHEIESVLRALGEEPV